MVVIIISLIESERLGNLVIGRRTRGIWALGGRGREEIIRANGRWLSLKSRRETISYTRCVNDAIHPLDSFVKEAQLFVIVYPVKIVNLNEIELPGVLWSSLHHSLALCYRPRRTADPNAAAEELVDNVRTNKAGRTRDQDILPNHSY